MFDAVSESTVPVGDKNEVEEQYRLLREEIFQQLSALFEEKGGKRKWLTEQEGMVTEDGELVTAQWNPMSYFVEAGKIQPGVAIRSPIALRQGDAVFLLSLGKMVYGEDKESEPVLVMLGNEMIDIKGTPDSRTVVARGHVLKRDGTSYVFERWVPSYLEELKNLQQRHTSRVLKVKDEELSKFWNKTYQEMRSQFVGEVYAPIDVSAQFTNQSVPVHAA